MCSVVNLFARSTPRLFGWLNACELSFSPTILSLFSQAEAWKNLDMSADRLLSGSEMPERDAVHLRSWLECHFNTVTWELGRPREDVLWISSPPSAHIMNTQVPWKQSARPTVVREQNCSQMLPEIGHCQPRLRSMIPRWDFSFFFCLPPLPLVFCPVHAVFQKHIGFFENVCR